MKSEKTKRIAGIGLLMALVVVMQSLSGVIPPIGGFCISLVLIPIVLGGAAYGIWAGAILGGTFGLVVYLNCLTGVDPYGGMVLQANAYLCFLVVMGKGIAAGVLSALTYKLLRNVNPYLAMLCAAIVCPVVNTGVFVVCMLTFFVDVLSQWAAGGDIMGYVLTGLILANFVPELIINIAFSPAGQRILHIVKK